MRLDTSLGTQTHADCIAAVRHAAAALDQLGHEVIETEFDLPHAEFRRRYNRLWSLAGTRGILSAATATGQTADEIANVAEPFNQYLFEQGMQISAAQYLQDHGWFHAMSRKICTHDAQFDVVLSPTLGTPPPKLGHFDARGVGGEVVMDRFYEFLGFSLIANLTGQPAVSLPLFLNDNGLPIGVQLTGPVGCEGPLLSLSSQLEQAKPWIARFAKGVEG
jgi:amidase